MLQGDANIPELLVQWADEEKNQVRNRTPYGIDMLSSREAFATFLSFKSVRLIIASASPQLPDGMGLACSVASLIPSEGCLRGG
jgi:hypothetical protein